MRHRLAKSVLVLSLVCAGAANARDHKDVAAANEGFYEALNRMFTGDVEPMKDIWSHKKNVTYMGPRGGILTGWEAVWKEWEAQGALKLGGKVEATDVHIVSDGELAIVTDNEVGENQTAKGVERVSIRATNVFRKQHGRWKMIAHHTDPLPYLANK
jgi:ketosteroid isomerase-like protein